MTSRHFITLTALLLLLSPIANAEFERKIVIDESKTSSHSTKVNSKKFDYTATTGTQPVWDEEGNPIASLFYTYYQRSKVKNRAARPLLISFNEDL